MTSHTPAGHDLSHGNYPSYYKKRPNLRIHLFPHALFRDATVLDIGSNDGHVTTAIAQNLNPRHIAGVDIDNSLVEAAWRHRLAAWSLTSPTHIPDYFPSSFPHEFGLLPIPASDASGHDKHAFPHNLTFRCADWTRHDIPEDKPGYDVVLAFVLFQRLVNNA